MSLDERSISPRLDRSRDFIQELRTHRGFDEDMAHGSVTLNIKHTVESRSRANSALRREFSNSNPNSPDDEFLESQLEETKMSNHAFVDQTIPFGAFCDYCGKKIWSKTVRQCCRCLKVSHIKCEGGFDLPCVPMSASLPDEYSASSRPSTQLNSRFSLPDFSKSDSKKSASASSRSSIASSAYQKIRDLKTKRSSAMEKKKLSVESESRKSDRDDSSRLVEPIDFSSS